MFTLKSKASTLLVCFLVSCLGTSAENGPVDAERVMKHVDKIVSYGPHPPGSEAQKKIATYIADTLNSHGLEVHRQTFKTVTPIGRVELTNVWGELKGRRDPVLLFGSHYDSKYFEEMDFVGANDSGSSTALLLELSRILARENPTEYSLWFVFFDGEEAFLEWTSADSLYGSREFVKMLKRTQQLHRIAAVLVLDMVGAKDLELRKDLNSSDWLNDIIWGKAQQMGYGNLFQTRGRTRVVDDHVPFAEEGIPVVDLIDMNYAYWHQSGDTPDKLSPENMKIVGDVVLASLPEIARRLSENRIPE